MEVCDGKFGMSTAVVARCQCAGVSSGEITTSPRDTNPSDVSNVRWHTGASMNYLEIKPAGQRLFVEHKTEMPIALTLLDSLHPEGIARRH